MSRTKLSCNKPRLLFGAFLPTQSKRLCTVDKWGTEYMQHNTKLFGCWCIGVTVRPSYTWIGCGKSPYQFSFCVQRSSSEVLVCVPTSVSSVFVRCLILTSGPFTVVVRATVTVRIPPLLKKVFFSNSSAAITTTTKNCAR